MFSEACGARVGSVIIHGMKVNGVKVGSVVIHCS